MDSLTSPNMGSLHMLMPRYVEKVQKNMTSGCVAYDTYYEPPYQYDPSLVAGIIFCVCFFVGTAAHLWTTISKRKWFYLSFVLGAVGELLGWIARTMAHGCPYNSTIFSIQISVLILAPCFLSAGIYYSLGQLIRLWGGRHSPLSQKWYLGIFITGDIVSIMIQAAGGAIAAHESSSGEDTSTGSNIMLIGIIVQLISMAIFTVLWTLVNLRARVEKTFYALRPFILSTTAATVLIVLRNIYRCIELALGWKGYLNRTEVFFCVFDAAFMVIAVLLLAWWHPARHIPKDLNENSVEKHKLGSGSDMEVGNRPYGQGQPANYQFAQGSYANYGQANGNWQQQQPAGNANIGQPMGQPNHLYASQYGR